MPEISGENDQITSDLGVVEPITEDTDLEESIEKNKNGLPISTSEFPLQQEKNKNDLPISASEFPLQQEKNKNGLPISTSEFPMLNGPLKVGRRYKQGRDAVIFTPDVRRKVFELACDGKSCDDIAAIIGATRQLTHLRCKDEIRKGNLIAKANLIKVDIRQTQSLVLSEHDRFQIQSMAGVGLKNTEIALIMNIPLSILQTIYQEDLYLGRANAHAKVATVLYDMAVDYEHPNETKFFLKAQHGWKEATQIEFPDADGRPQSISSNVNNLQLNDAKIQLLIEQLNERV
jgi:hypothetical protein